MDNTKQIEEVLRFQEYLSSLTGINIATDLAAQIWVRKYARIWRLRHPRIHISPQAGMPNHH